MPRSLVCIALLLALVALGTASPAAASRADVVRAEHGAGHKVVRFAGRAVKAPKSWPVFRLAERPGMCVRLDRRAVYLGTPSASQRCPSHAIGRVRAIVIDPRAKPVTRGAAAAAKASSSAVGPAIRRGGASISASAPYTGLGFDACTAPSQRTMTAWGASPYRAIGIYVGGVNRACSQPNLTTTWVATQLAAGWHLIPIYVGRQAPTSSCGSCAELSLTLFRATIQGAEAADDAVAQMQAIGIGPGNPIYFDMESYTQTSSASKATLTFLAAWTDQLHALGYTSGVYSSSASGIEDLVDQIGTGYPLPDDIWMANWNGQANALDPYVPSNAWADHQRIHQYRGGHDETYAGIKINIDNNFVEGATVGAPAPAPVLPPLTVLRVKRGATSVRVRVRCGWAAGETCPGQIILRSHMRSVRGRGGTRVIRVAVGHRIFRLGGGRAHTFHVPLNARGRPLVRERRRLKAQLLVAIPGARATRTVEFKQAR